MNFRAKENSIYVAFSTNDCNALVRLSFDNAQKICEEQELSIEERRVRKKKRMRKMEVHLLVRKLNVGILCLKLQTSFRMKHN